MREDPAAYVERLKAETDAPLRTHGSLTLARTLLAAGLVDRLELMVFPAITGSSGYAGLLHEGAESTSTCSRRMSSTAAR